MEQFQVDPQYLPSENARQSIDSERTMEILSTLGITRLSHPNELSNHADEAPPKLVNQETSTSTDDQPISFG